MTDLERELSDKVQDWVAKQFNNIQLEVVEAFCAQQHATLHDYIANPTVRESFLDWLDDNDDSQLVNSFWGQRDDSDSDLIQKYSDIQNHTIKDAFKLVFGEEAWDEFVDFCVEEYEDDIQEYIYEQENYPVWNTLFEFRDSAWNNETDMCIKHGLGVIEGLEPFNNMLFMTSAGHSFYSAYWIPLYLNIYSDEREKYKDVDYSHL